jgi:glutathione synthase/RimK-type ligase-like ATP-grasp enzyme
MQTQKTLTAHQIRAVSVAAETDPRTVVKYLQGVPGKGVVRQRIDRAFSKLKLPKPAPHV